MKQYAYRLLKVFAIPGDMLSGNPLCVFEGALGADATQRELRPMN